MNMRSKMVTLLQNLMLMKFEIALCNIKPNLELSLPKLSTNLSSVRIRTKGDPVLLMENLVTIAKRRDIFQCCWNFDSKVDFVQQNMDNSDLNPELLGGNIAQANIAPQNCFRTLKNKPNYINQMLN